MEFHLPNCQYFVDANLIETKPNSRLNNLERYKVTIDTYRAGDQGGSYYSWTKVYAKSENPDVSSPAITNFALIDYFLGIQRNLSAKLITSAESGRAHSSPKLVLSLQRRSAKTMDLFQQVGNSDYCITGNLPDRGMVFNLTSGVPHIAPLGDNFQWTYGKISPDGTKVFVIGMDLTNANVIQWLPMEVRAYDITEDALAPRPIISFERGHDLAGITDDSIVYDWTRFPTVNWADNNTVDLLEYERYFPQLGMTASEADDRNMNLDIRTPYEMRSTNRYWTYRV